jgi:hypothetical protein
MMTLRIIPTCNQIEWRYASNQDGGGNGKEEIRFYLKYLSDASESSSLIDEEPRQSE